MTNSFDKIPPFDDETGDLHVIIDTPKDSRNKYKYDEKLGIFKLGGVLPVGAFFPFDFGYIPQTLGGDGDPLDVLVLIDEPAFVGCLIPSRLIGVIEAEQTEDGATERNDRLLAVAANSATHRSIRKLSDLSQDLIEQIEHFFVSYNEIKGKRFEVKGRASSKRGLALVTAALRGRR